MNLEETLKIAKAESRRFMLAEDEKIVAALNDLAESLEKNCDLIIEENKKDLAKLDKTDPLYDRILLTAERISDMAASLREIAGYESPIGKILEERTLKSGLELRKISTPIGVIGAIFEARPNVVVDIFALCFKSKNVCVLKGGSDAESSNGTLIRLIKESVEKFFGESNMVHLLPNDRALIAEFLKMDRYVDVIVPRGSQSLIDFVRQNSSIPVIETGAGVVHTFFDESARTEMGAEIIFNAKTQRPGVCNALDTLIVHRARLKDLPELCAKLATKEVEIFADREAFEALKGHYPENLLKEAKEENFGTEYLSLKMSIKTVGGLDEAIGHINTFGSGHSEAIITENEENGEKFMAGVDAAAVYVNASTRFTDGGQYGLGAEVGISTQKLHARGPMGIKELTSYKWLLKGSGQIRQ